MECRRHGRRSFIGKSWACSKTGAPFFKTRYAVAARKPSAERYELLFAFDPGFRPPRRTPPWAFIFRASVALATLLPENSVQDCHREDECLESDKSYCDEDCKVKRNGAQSQPPLPGSQNAERQEHHHARQCRTRTEYPGTPRPTNSQSRETQSGPYDAKYRRHQQ